MKAILLQTPCADNGGVRRDAGTELAVGDKPDQIVASRAKALIASFSAVDVLESAKPAKKAD